MKWRLLLVDDDESDRLAFQRVLQAEGIDADLRIATNGRQALDMIASASDAAEAAPDLILLDLNMDELNGFEVLKILKLSVATKSIPVVVLTTSSNSRDIESCYALGANSYIVKPASLGEYAHIVRVLKKYWTDIVATPGRAA